eukprot:scaffold6531_cov169-Ochromonas_danica.AAC.11
MSIVNDVRLTLRRSHNLRAAGGGGQLASGGALSVILTLSLSHDGATFLRRASRQGASRMSSRSTPAVSATRGVSGVAFSVTRWRRSEEVINSASDHSTKIDQ